MTLRNRGLFCTLAAVSAGVALPLLLSAADKPADPEPVWANLPGSRARQTLNGARPDPNAGPQGSLVAGPATCPAVIIGTRIYALPSLELKSDPSVEGLEDSSLRALSADGQLFAAATMQKKITVCQTSTGKPTATLTLTGGGPNFLAFAGKDTLVTNSFFDEQLSLWSISTQKLLRTIPTHQHLSDRSQIAVSPDGHYLVWQAGGAILWYDARTGTHLFDLTSQGATAAPAARAGAGSASPPTPAATARPPSRTASTGAPPRARATPSPMPAPAPQAPAGANTLPPPAMKGVQSMAFSSDSREFAALGDDGRMIVWNTAGKVVFDEPGVAPGHRTSFRWLPDNSGWILGSNDVYLRNIQMVVIHRRGMDNPESAIPLSRDKLLVGHTWPAARYEVVTLPMNSVDKIVAVAQTDSAAPLNPGQPVAVDWNLKNLRGDAADTKRQFTIAFTPTFTSRGIAIDPAAALHFVIDYEEKAGENLPIVDSNSMPVFDQTTHAFTQTIIGHATGTVGNIHVRLVDAHGNALFEKSGTFKSGTSYNGKVDDTVLRNSVVSQVNGFLSSLPLPGYIPSNPATGTLPIYNTP
jgi:hypothetical protein